MDLHGKTVLITGASSGIGASAARAFAAAGARVLLVARTAATLEAVAETVRTAGGTAEALPCDLSDATAVQALADDVVARFGAPDVVVNNAGAGRWLSVEETEPAEAVQMMQAPYFAAFFVTHALLPAMIARRRGAIVQVNSPACILPIPGAAGYAASRAALRTFSLCLEAELKGTGVWASHVMLGKVDSPYFSNNPGSEDRIPAINVLLPTMTPDEAADTLVDTVVRERKWVTVPLMARLFEWLFDVAPWLVLWLVRVTGWKRPST